MIDINLLYRELIRPALSACFVQSAPNLLVLDYEPTSVQTMALVYSLLDSRSVGTVNQLMPITYRTFHRVCVNYAEPDGAEQIIQAYIDRLPNALITSREFEQINGVEPLIKPSDGRIGGSVTCEDGKLGFVMIAGTKCRVYDFYSSVLVKLRTDLVRTL